MDEKLISYRHVTDEKDKVRFVQYAKDPVPDWARDIREYDEPVTTPERPTP